MKKVLVFVILQSLFIILLCPSIKAQWEGAQVQRLTYNEFPNEVKGLYIDEDDKLLLFYEQWKWDPLNPPFRDSLFLITKEKQGGWSQPQKIGNSLYDTLPCNKVVAYDAKRSVIHIIYPGGGLYYTNSKIPNWEVAKIDTPTNMREYFGPTIVFDSLGNVHLAWCELFDSTGGNWYRVKYANNSTGEWVKQQVSPPIWLGGFTVGGPPFLDVQKNGIAHFVYEGEPYCDTECVAFYTRNDSLNGTNWITDTVPHPPRTLWHYAAGPVKVDVNDRVHLITTGCIVWDCTWPRLRRNFYYYKQAEDSIWQGPEQIPDTMFGFMSYIPQLLVDKQGVPYMSCQTTSNEAYFTDRKQGSWQVPYFLVGWSHDPPPPESLSVSDFCFVLDSEGKGHGAFSGYYISQGWSSDSFEIYYLSSSSNSFLDTLQDHEILSFKLFQNYPNPFNSSTIISYVIKKEGNVALKIYDILGREVRQLVNGIQKPGNYRFIWDGKDNQGKEVASGIYFYQLRAGNFTRTKKLVLIK